MKKQFTLICMTILAVITTACHNDKPVIDSSDVAIPTDTQSRYSTAKIGNIIAETAANKGYSVNKAGSGLIKVQLLNRRDGSVEVSMNIHYTHTNYGITPDANTPSDPRLFTKYSASLRREIDKRLSMAAYQ